MFERMIFLADDLAAIEVGGRLVMVEPAAFDQHDAVPLCQQPASGRLPRGARTDDGHVGGNSFRRVNRAIDTHSTPCRAVSGTPSLHGRAAICQPLAVTDVIFVADCIRAIRDKPTAAS